ncbi:hypothetical protein [Ferrovibrio sp.]
MEISPRPLSDTEKRDWLRLIHSENIGSITFHTPLSARRWRTGPRP